MDLQIEDVEVKLSVEQSTALLLLTDPRFQDVTRVVFGGQAGGGKSFLISLWLDSMAENYPGTRYYLARETLKDIKESVLLTFFDVARLTGSKLRFLDSRSKIIYPNWSEIYLVETAAYPSDPNFERLGSREYTAGAIEEGIGTDKRAANLLISRTRYKHDVYNLTPKQLITCNPGDGWIKDEIVIPTLEGQKISRNNKFVRASLESNPNKKFREMYGKTLEENLTAYDKARLLHGDWNAKPKSGAEYFKEFKPDVHGKFTHVYDPELPLHLSFDENVHPYITCGIFQLFKDEAGIRHLRQIGEICQPPPLNTRRHVCTAIKKLFPNHKTGMYIYGDASSWKASTEKSAEENFFTDITAELREYKPKLRVPNSNPSVIQRAGFINLIFEKGYRKIEVEIDHRCKKSISDYAYSIEDEVGGILKKMKKDSATGISYQEFGHHCDMLCYIICELFAADYEYYQNGSRSGQYHTGSERGEEQRFRRD